MIFTAGVKRTSRLAAALVLSLAATTTASAACSDPAALGVDWEGCQLTSAQLNNANLTGANLSGTNLGGALWINGMQCAKVSIGECK
jgi:uncharacterized protein YjbI with pentapeptide repeats